MTYIGNTSPSRFSSVPAVQRFSGNNSTNAFTLSTAIGSEQEILVSVDGVIQDTANYTVSGTTLTFSPAPSAGTNNIFVFTLSRAIASVTHPSTSALSATSGTFSGNVSVGGDLDVTGSLDMSDANLTNVGSIQLDSISGDADTNTNITFSGSDVITFTTGGSTAFTANANQSVTFSGSITGTTATLTTDDNLPQLTVVSTDADANLGPIIRLYRNSASPADGDSTGKIEFQAKTDTGVQTTYASLNTVTSDVSNGSPDATFYIQTLTNNSHSNRFFISPTETVLNEDSVDADFRVEGNNDTHSLFVQAGSDHVGINNSSPNSSFTGADNLVIGAGSGHTGMTILSGTSSRSSIEFSDGTGSDAAKTAGGIRYYHDNNYMRFNTNGGTERVRIDASGNVGIGNTIPSSFNSQARNLVVGTGSGDAGITVYSGSGSGDSGNIFFADGTSGSDPVRGGITYNHETNAMNLRVNDSPRMYIDASGRVLIGTTTEGEGSADDLTIATTSHTGITIRSGTSHTGNIYFSDGTSGVDEYDGYMAYSHSTRQMYVYSGVNYGFNIDGANHTIDVMDAGNRRLRFSNNGINFGTDTAANNALDDYEEGTWSPQIYAGGNITTSNITANYTKIGKFVSLQAQFVRGSSSGGGNTLQINGLPFAHGSGSGMPGNAWIDNVGTDLRTMLYIDNGATTVYFTKTGATSAYVSINEWENGRWIYLYLNYRTAS